MWPHMADAWCVGYWVASRRREAASRRRSVAARVANKSPIHYHHPLMPDMSLRDLWGGVVKLKHCYAPKISELEADSYGDPSPEGIRTKK
jgi:hypothetical protein